MKVFWAPVVDRLALPLLSHLGQRRGWILAGQLGIIVGLVLMSMSNPASSLLVIALAAVLVAFCSSTQDVAVDALRIESAEDELQGMLSAAYIFGYRAALLVAGAGALYIAEFGSWALAYLCMAGLMGLGVAAVLWADEPTRISSAQRDQNEIILIDQIMGRPMQMAQRPGWQRWLLGAVVCPVLEFFSA